jgi:hypothetical protein
MAQQTAVEWLVKEVNSDCLNSAFIRHEIVEKAKAMEKEQIIKAADHNFSYDDNGYPTLGEIYYNERYDRAADTK